MLLIFPTIEIRRGSCVLLVRGEAGAERIYSVDPVQMAILWRGENAKTLHIVDLDAVATGEFRNLDMMKRMVEAAEIPLQVGGGLRTVEDVQRLFEIGVYRVVLGTVAVENPALVGELLKKFGASKIAVSIESKNRNVLIHGKTKPTGISPRELALQMKTLGINRIVYTELTEDEGLSQEYYDALKELALESKIRLTARGGVAGYRDLIRLQELEPYGVDSVIIGRPLYENVFPCQRLWRINEKELTDLGPTRRM
jgi:phosphoribosylformimino-5-aminoimidazole carboxamide ribotide isomerase